MARAKLESRPASPALKQLMPARATTPALLQVVQRTQEPRQGVNWGVETDYNVGVAQLDAEYNNRLMTESQQPSAATAVASSSKAMVTESPRENTRATRRLATTD